MVIVAVRKKILKKTQLKLLRARKPPGYVASTPRSRRGKQRPPDAVVEMPPNNLQVAERVRIRDGLTNDERELVDTAFTAGPAAFFDAGLNGDEVKQFLNRPEVSSRLNVLETEYNNREAFELRTRFMVQRTLAKDANKAAKLLTAALDGTQFAIGVDGDIKRDERTGLPVVRLGPNSAQLTAASEVLDRLGCRSDPRITGGSIEVNIGLLLSKAAEEATVKLAEDTASQSPAERALHRERVRVLMERLAPIVRQKADYADKRVEQRTTATVVQRKVPENV